jgi:hypothetical protein
MAVIRCQACGKPNPEFLDVCQYCEARLKPLTTGPLTMPEAAKAASAPAAPTPVSAPVSAPAPAPAPTTTQQLRSSAKVIRCQACGKPNPAFMDTCQYCEARLKPLTGPLTPPPEELRAPVPPEALAAPEPSAAAQTEPDWMWTGAGATTQPEPHAPAPSQPEPDWMWAGAAATEEPQAAAPTEEVPDWLSSLRGAEAAAPAPADEIPDWLREPQSPETAQPEPQAFMPAAPAEEIPDWLRTMPGAEPTQPESAAPAEEIPDWLRAMQTPESTVEPPTFTPAAPAPAEEVPDWLRAMQASETAPAEPSAFAPPAPMPSGEMPDWLRAMQPGETAPPSPFTPEPSSTVEAAPDWLSAAGSAETAPTPAPAFDLGPGEAEEPDWLKSVREEAHVPTEPAKPGTAPFVSAPAGAEAELPAEAALPAEAEVPTGAMPDWLAAIRPADITAIPTTPPPEPAPEHAPLAFTEALAGEGLAQAALPSWLQAMRPVEVQQPVLQPETDTYEETVGVLAGMRGVLQAEPTVALPRKSTVQVHRLEVSSAEAALADLISGLVSDERLARPAARRRVQWTPLVERLAVAAVMLAAILIPYFFPGFFPLPTTVSTEVQAAFNLVEAQSPDQPALVVFDYEPGQTGELDPAAMAIVTHLLRRGVPVVGVSTRPSGPGVAEAVFDAASEHLQQTTSLTPTYGADYLNLGYIPGGPAGVAQFASDPRLLFSTDFRGTQAVWQQPILGSVKDDVADTLGTDFGLIVLVEAAPDSARSWIEQTRGVLEGTDTKVVAVVSAGADPLVRPYYADAGGSADLPLSGFVSGAVGATEYQYRAGLFADGDLHIDAQGRWDVLGGGLLTAALILVVGAAVHLVQRTMRAGKRGS